MIEKGISLDDFEDEEEEQSEEESNTSDDKSKTAKPPAGKEEMKNKPLMSQTMAASPQPFMQTGMDYNKMLVVGEGYGREFLKSEIERLIKVLQDKQSVGSDVHTFIRADGSRKGWEEDAN